MKHEILDESICVNCRTPILVWNEEQKEDIGWTHAYTVKGNHRCRCIEPVKQGVPIIWREKPWKSPK